MKTSHKLLLTTAISATALTLSAGLFPHLTHAANCDATAIRYASSNNRLYISGGVSCTLSQIKTLYPKALLDQLPNNTWLLRSNVILENGATLVLNGTAVGGDVDQLRLQSNNTGSATDTIYVRADWGNILINNTKITSWDSAKNGPDTNYTNGRSFIHIRSKLAPDGTTPLESRMDILNSDIGYLGYYAAESYGLVWKVAGVPGPFDKVNVYGDVKNSRLHHHYFGAYTYGAYGMQWINNEIDNNVGYGLDPHDDSDSLVIDSNRVHDNGYHGIICSQRCDHLSITNNKSYNNKKAGMMLHRNTNETLVEGNELYNNADSGLAIFDSHNNTIRNNSSHNNKNGLRFSVGSSNNLVQNNNLSDNNTYGIYFYKGSDAPTTGDGRPKNNTFTGNIVNNNKDFVIKAKETDGNTFENNQLRNNAKGVVLDNAKNNAFTNNSLTGTRKPYFTQLNGSSGNTFTGNN